jgi:hypothetical protein
MTDTRTLGQQLQGQFLEAVRKSQDTVVDAVKSFEDAVKPWTEAVQKLTPQLPGVAAQSPVADVVDKLPKPADLVDDAYSFAEQLLTAQKEFAHKMLDAAAPFLGYPTK